MSEKVSSLQVIFDKPVSEEYAEMVRKSISLISHVTLVTVNTNNPSIEFSATIREQHRITDKLFTFIKTIKE